MARELAVRQQMKLCALFTGVEGSGKTLSGLKLLYFLTEGKGKIGVIDTEHGRSMLYAPPPKRDPDLERNWFAFYQYPLDKYSPEDYINAMKEAMDDGCDALLVDSITHEWEGTGGILESTIGESERTSFFEWKKGTRNHNRFLTALFDATQKLHVCCTARTKAEYIIEGKTPRKVGMGVIQRETTPFEFTLIGNMDNGTLTVTKATNAEGLVGKSFEHPGLEFATLVNDWLGIGAIMPMTRDDFITSMVKLGFEGNAQIAEFVKAHPEITGTYRYEKLVELAQSR